MKRILVAFASREGQTEKIAHHIARRIEDKGLATRLVNLNKGSSDEGADDCDAVILAGSIPGETQTLPVAIYASLQRAEGETSAVRLAVISVVVAVGAILAAEACNRRLHRARQTS